MKLCDGCRFFIRFAEDSNGECAAFPPVHDPHSDYKISGKEAWGRPPVDGNDPACLYYQAEDEA